MVVAESAERMDVAVAGAIPVANSMPSLNVAWVAPHEFALIDLEHLIELLDVRQRRLADTDDADLVGFDQDDAVIVGRGSRRASAAAVIQPAVPPPRMTTRNLFSAFSTRSIPTGKRPYRQLGGTAGELVH